MTNTALRNELARLEAAAPSNIPAFAESRGIRIAELKRLLLDARDEALTRDERLETALRNSRGGDRFGRR